MSYQSLFQDRDFLFGVSEEEEIEIEIPIRNRRFSQLEILL